MVDRGIDPSYGHRRHIDQWTIIRTIVPKTEDRLTDEHAEVRSVNRQTDDTHTNSHTIEWWLDYPSDYR